MIPKLVQQEIRSTVFQRADEHDYINKTRPENNRFMHALIEDPQIGGRLSAYLEESQIKTYIKDGILNQYSKNKFSPPVDIDALIQKKLKCHLIQVEERPDGRSFIYRTRKQERVLAVCGTYAKWETALRRALETKAMLRGNVDKIVLLITVQARLITEPDMKLVEKSLRAIGIECVFHKI